NNVLGQVLLTKRMGKTRAIADAGAGQHGAATATVCALPGLDSAVYMAETDTRRHAPNGSRMRMLGAEVIQATPGTRTPKDAQNCGKTTSARRWAPTRSRPASTTRASARSTPG